MDQKPMSTKYLLKRFYPYFKPYWHILVFDLFCASLTSVCDLVLPVIASNSPMIEFCPCSATILTSPLEFSFRVRNRPSIGVK